MMGAPFPFPGLWLSTVAEREYHDGEEKGLAEQINSLQIFFPMLPGVITLHHWSFPLQKPNVLKESNKGSAHLKAWFG